jgi:hypothetical protein
MYLFCRKNKIDIHFFNFCNSFEFKVQKDKQKKSLVYL